MTWLRKQLEPCCQGEGQIVGLEGILSGLSEDHSRLKEIALSLTSTTSAMGHTISSDEVIKTTFAEFACENFEIAAYKSLIVVAEAGRHNAAANSLNANPAADKAIAEWLGTNIAAITTQFLSLREAGGKTNV